MVVNTKAVLYYLIKLNLKQFFFFEIVRNSEFELQTSKRSKYQSDFRLIDFVNTLSNDFFD